MGGKKSEQMELNFSGVRPRSLFLSVLLMERSDDDSSDISLMTSFFITPVFLMPQPSVCVYARRTSFSLFHFSLHAVENFSMDRIATASERESETDSKAIIQLFQNANRDGNFELYDSRGFLFIVRGSGIAAVCAHVNFNRFKRGRPRIVLHLRAKVCLTVDNRVYRVEGGAE